jgi:hypothetical protein
MPFGILRPTFAIDMLHSADVHDAAMRNMQV